MRDVKVSTHDVKQFARAVEIAHWGMHHRVRVGALLAKGRRTRGKAFNVIQDWPESAQYLVGHAERQVIKDQPAFKGTLYVARIQLNDGLAPSWPCRECMENILACGCVSKVVYWNGAEIRKVRL